MILGEASELWPCKWGHNVGHSFERTSDVSIFSLELVSFSRGSSSKFILEGLILSVTTQFLESDGDEYISGQRHSIQHAL